MARRRRSSVRDPALRSEMWYRKMDPKVYEVYLTATKDLRFPLVQMYQVVQEELIKIVRECTANLPEESVRQHAYMWFAQGIWYITQRYRD